MDQSPPRASAAPAIIAAAMTLLFWGGTAVANRYAVAFADPIAIATLRSMLAGLLALCIALSLRLKFPAAGRDRLLLLVSGLLNFALWPIILSIGLAHTTASHAALIMAVLPILTVLIAAVLHRSWPPAAWWWGSLIAVGATVFLVLDQGASLGVANASEADFGDLIILAGCILCAAGYVIGGKLTPKIGSLATTFWGLSLALLLTAPVFWLYPHDSNWAALPQSAWAAIAWLTLCSSLLGYLTWFFALGRGGIERIGSLALLMPVITLLGAVLILDEELTATLVVLSVLVLAGTLLAHRYATRS